MRRFEERYRINEGDDVLNRENAIHQDVDLRLDAIELLGQAFAEGNRADIDAILKSLEQTFGTLAAEMRGLLDQASGGLSADIIVETPARYFLTDARRGAILSDLRGGVDASGDTLAKLLALIVGVVGGAPVGRQSLKALNDAVVANTATLSAITSGADPTLDSFAEVLMRLIADEGQISAVMTALGNRLRLDAPGGYSEAYRGQGRANLVGAPASVSTNGVFAAADVGRKVRASGTITRTLPSISAVFAGWATGEVENTGAGIITVAAASGDAFEGTAGGSFVLLPKQRAYVYLDTDGWHVGWVDRTPIVASITLAAAAAFVDLPLPAGYASPFEFTIGGLAFAAASGDFGLRVSNDGGASFKSGASDYALTAINAPSGASAPNTYSAGGSLLSLIEGVGTANIPAIIEGKIHVGTASARPTISVRQHYVSGSANVTVRQVYGRYDPGALTANALRFLATGTNILAGATFTVRAGPQ